MKTITGYFSLVILAVLLVSAPDRSRAADDAPRELKWDDLMPKDWTPFDPWSELDQSQIQRLVDGSPEEQRLMREYVEAKSSAPVVAALDGQRVRLPGYVVPLDFNGPDEVSEFLLVPYFGACIHVPPPPSNQIVYVKADKAYVTDGMFTPVWVTGTLSTKAFLNLVGDAGYTLKATKIEPYQ